MKGHAFCYFHAQSHRATRIGVMDNLYLPVAENPAAIQLAISQTIQAMLASRITTKQAGLMLYGLAVGAALLKRKPEPLSEPISTASPSIEGDDLAPELCIDEEGGQHTDCTTCPQREKCDRLLEDDSEPGETVSEAPHIQPQHSNPEAQPEESQPSIAEAQPAHDPNTAVNTGAKNKSNYRTGRVRSKPINLIPKTPEEIVKRFGDSPLIRKYFNIESVALAEAPPSSELGTSTRKATADPSLAASAAPSG
jgi:hypothetical protein